MTCVNALNRWNYALTRLSDSQTSADCTCVLTWMKAQSEYCTSELCKYSNNSSKCNMLVHYYYLIELFLHSVSPFHFVTEATCVEITTSIMINNQNLIHIEHKVLNSKKNNLQLDLTNFVLAVCSAESVFKNLELDLLINTYDASEEPSYLIKQLTCESRSCNNAKWNLFTNSSNNCSSTLCIPG